MNSSTRSSNKRIWKLLSGVLASCAVVAACRAPRSNGRPPPETSTLEVHVPAGCLSNLSGEYVHAANTGYRYLAVDDGTTLTMSVARTGAETSRSSDGGMSIQIRLTRTAKGFLGHAQATGTLSSGQTCPAEFLTEVVSCGKSEMVLRSVGEVFLDEACRPPQGGNPGAMREHRLVRIDESQAKAPPDAG